MRIVYVVYPVFMWTSCLVIFLCGMVTTVMMLNAAWVMWLWPALAAMIGSIVTNSIAARFPKIRYVNESEVDGLGYVHSSGQILIPFLIVAYMICGAMVLFG
ncbi:MAG: hypothetical protein ACE5KM_17265 [Planctomycetaceae bacterium]